MKVNADKIEWQESVQGGFAYFRKQLGSKAGGEKNKQSAKIFYRKTSEVPYYDGEK